MLREFDTETGLYYYRARYYDPASGRFLSEDPLEFAAGNGANFYSYAINSPTNWVDASGMNITCPSFLAWLCIPPPPPIPVGDPPWFFPNPKHHPAAPSLPLGNLLNCIAHSYGAPIFYNSTSEFDPKVGHTADTPHGRGEAADIAYPADPEKLLCAAKNCGAGYTRDELLYPSPKQNGPHVHVQLGGRGNTLPPVGGGGPSPYGGGKPSCCSK
jgi:RHS repeat-associated protein